ncbi:MAG: hypothetical protein LBQ23_02920 [Puniceicoccales bacterium]|nr:hypothetical protein [Puniceicoccales bacterium]
MPNRLFNLEANDASRASREPDGGQRFQIGTGLLNDHQICYLISVAQLFYHMGNIPASLLNVGDRGDNVFVLRRLFVDMKLGRIEGREKLA